MQPYCLVPQSQMTLILKLQRQQNIFYRPLFSEGQPFVLPYLCFRYSNHRPQPQAPLLSSMHEQKQIINGMQVSKAMIYLKRFSFGAFSSLKIFYVCLRMMITFMEFSNTFSAFLCPYSFFKVQNIPEDVSSVLKCIVFCYVGLIPFLFLLVYSTLRALSSLQPSYGKIDEPIFLTIDQLSLNGLEVVKNVWN